MRAVLPPFHGRHSFGAGTGPLCQGSLQQPLRSVAGRGPSTSGIDCGSVPPAAPVTVPLIVESGMLAERSTGSVADRLDWVVSRDLLDERPVLRVFQVVA